MVANLGAGALSSTAVKIFNWVERVGSQATDPGCGALWWPEAEANSMEESVPSWDLEATIPKDEEQETNNSHHYRHMGRQAALSVS